jgi:hypothetical protein
VHILLALEAVLKSEPELTVPLEENMAKVFKVDESRGRSVRLE